MWQASDRPLETNRSFIPGMSSTPQARGLRWRRWAPGVASVYPRLRASSSVSGPKLSPTRAATNSLIAVLVNVGEDQINQPWEFRAFSPVQGPANRRGCDASEHLTSVGGTRGRLNGSGRRSSPLPRPTATADECMPRQTARTRRAGASSRWGFFVGRAEPGPRDSAGEVVDRNVGDVVVDVVVVQAVRFRLELPSAQDADTVSRLRGRP